MGTFSSSTHQLKDGTAVCIRSAIEDDAEAVIDHAKSVFSTSQFLITEPEEFTVTLEQEKKWIAGYLEAPNGVLIVAEAAGKIVGLTDFGAYRRKRLEHSGTLAMSVRREYQGKGLGYLLLESALTWAKTRPTLERIELGVLDGNVPAISLYKKLGFKEEGRKLKAVRFKDGQYVDEILMVRVL